MSVFILNSLGIESPAIHASLSMVGAVELRELLEAGIVLSRDHAAEWEQLPDHKWFDQFSDTFGNKTLEDLDRKVFKDHRKLTPVVVQFAKGHEAELFEAE